MKLLEKNSRNMNCFKIQLLIPVLSYRIKRTSSRFKNSDFSFCTLIYRHCFVSILFIICDQTIHTVTHLNLNFISLRRGAILLKLMVMFNSVHLIKCGYQLIGNNDRKKLLNTIRRLDSRTTWLRINLVWFVNFGIQFKSMNKTALRNIDSQISMTPPVSPNLYFLCKYFYKNLSSLLGWKLKSWTPF